MNPFSAFIEKGSDHIGLDIGSCSVKAVELAHEKDTFRIKGMGYAIIEKQGSPESIVDAIKESVSMARITPNKSFNIAMPGSSVLARFIELPHMNADELKHAIVFEAEKYIPFSVNDMIIEHQLLIPRLSDNKMLVLLIAAKKDVVSDRLDIMNKAGLSVSILDATPLAVVNAFLSNAKHKKDEAASVIDIGAKESDISIIFDNTLYFTRNIQIGGNHLSKAISDSLAVGEKEAEELKINSGTRSMGVGECLKPVLNAISDEIRLSFSYYENQSGRSIGRVYLTGGAAKLVNIAGMLRERLDMEVEPWEAVTSMPAEISLKKELVDLAKYEMSAAIGLAVR